MTSSEPLFAELLGPVRAVLGETEVDLGAARRRSVFAVLALRANQPVALDELVAAVWGDEPPANAEASVYTYVSGLRRQLEPHRSARSASEVLVSTGFGYSLRLGRDATDVALFEAHRQRAASLDAEGALKELDAALALWRGEALAGVPGPFAATQRVRLAELRLVTAERRAELALGLGRHAEVVAELVELSGEHPLREGLRALLMTALHGSGRHAEALEVFRDTRRLLVEELGIEPGAELVGLHQRLLREIVAPATTLRVVLPTRTPPTAPPLLGRDREVDVVRRVVGELAEHGRGGHVWLEGEPGVGRTAVLAALLAEAGGRGCQVAWGVADELGAGFPLRVVLDCLEISASSPDPRRAAVAEVLLDTTAEVDLDSEQDAVERLVSLVSELCADGPLVLAVDDLHWSDRVSAVVWHRLARLARRSPLLLVGTCHPMPRREDVQRLRDAVLDSGGEVIRLTPLSDDLLVEVVARRLAATPSPGLRRLVEEAGGNPAYALEAVDELVRRGVVRVQAGVADMADEAQDGTWVPEATSTHRLDFLSPAALEVLRTGSLFGMGFAIGDVAVVLGRPPSELVAPVEEAMSAGVLAESHTDFTFRQPLVRHALYEGVLLPLRTALHQQAAQALSEAGASVVQVARQLAGAAPVVDAWGAAWIADHARDVMLADQELAVRLVGSVADRPSLNDAQRDRLESCMAWLKFWQGKRPESEARSVLARTKDPHLAAEMRAVLAMLYSGEGRDDLALETLRAAVENEATPEPCRTRQQALMADIHRSGQADVETAERAAHNAISRAHKADGFSIGQALRVLWQVSTVRRDHADALDRVDLALTMLNDQQDLYELRPVLLENRASTLQNLDRMDEAGQALRAARTRVRQGPSLAYLRAYTAVYLYWTGQWDEALTELAQASEVVTNYGTRDHGPALLVPGLVALIQSRRGRHDVARAQLAGTADHPIALLTDQEHAEFLLAARAYAAECGGAGPAEVFDHLEPLLRGTEGSTTMRHQWLPNAVRLAVSSQAYDLAERAYAVCADEAAKERVPARAHTAELRGRGILRGDPEPLRAAVARYRAVGRPVESAEALEDLSVVLAARGALEEAEAAHREAVAGYSALGAVVDVRRAQARLAAVGELRATG
ncbi:BTAD domain-containing putative transcriptional regulator [Actinosynnema sp. CA-299493]